MMRALVIAIGLGACGNPAGMTPQAPMAPLAPIDQPPAPGVVLGTVGGYVGMPTIDAFPKAAGTEGWGTGSNFGTNGIQHFIVLTADHDGSAAQAIARRGEITPTLPTNARLIYQASTPWGLDSWSLRSVVVETKPALEAADMATCEIVRRPNIVIDLSTNENTSQDWPWVHITWTPAAVAKLQALVDFDRNTRLYLALGDDVVNDWTPGYNHDGLGSAELQIPQPDARTAWAYAERNKHQLCPRGK